MYEYDLDFVLLKRQVVSVDWLLYLIAWRSSIALLFYLFLLPLQRPLEWSIDRLIVYMDKLDKSKGIPITDHDSPRGVVDTKVHILFAATALGRGGVASPTLGRLYPGKAPPLIL